MKTASSGSVHRSIEAKSFAEQVGVTVQELMTRGGNVSLGVQSYAPGTDVTLAPDITIKTGATIDMSGGWVTYQGGFVQTSQLISVARRAGRCR